MNIADRIRELRKNKGLSQEELAEQLGVSRQAISKWESEQSVPDIEKIILISDYFEVSTDYVLKGIELSNAIGKKTKKHIIISFSVIFALLAGVFSFAANRFRDDEIFFIAIAGAVVGGCIGFLLLKIIQIRTTGK